MSLDQIILIAVASVGWIVAIIQFFLRRKHQKNDRKAEAYISFLDKVDEVNRNLKDFPIFGFESPLFKKLLSGDPEEIEKALLDFNEELLKLSKRTGESMMTINQEIHKVTALCSDKLYKLIKEYQVVVNEFIVAFGSQLERLQSKRNLDATADSFQEMSKHPDGDKLIELFEKIRVQIRKELK